MAHKHGTMDIREQEKTYKGFIKVSIWVVALSLAAVIFLAIFNS